MHQNIQIHLVYHFYLQLVADLVQLGFHLIVHLDMQDYPAVLHR